MRVTLSALMARPNSPATTAYQLAQLVEAHGVSGRSAYRIVAAEAKGEVPRFLDTKLVDALCAVFDVEPGDFLKRDKPAKRR